MKSIIICSIILVVININAVSQNNMLSITGGWVNADIEDTDKPADGWRVNALYEVNPTGGPISYGISAGYMAFSANDTSEFQGVTQYVEYRISSVPICFVPKFNIGNEKIAGYLKGAAGLQFSTLKRTATAAEIKDNDIGFAGGGGAGVALHVNEKIALIGDWEALWLSNSYYRDGWTNTFSLGLGFKF